MVPHFYKPYNIRRRNDVLGRAVVGAGTAQVQRGGGRVGR